MLSERRQIVFENAQGSLWGIGAKMTDTQQVPSIGGSKACHHAFRQKCCIVDAHDLQIFLNQRGVGCLQVFGLLLRCSDGFVVGCLDSGSITAVVQRCGMVILRRRCYRSSHFEHRIFDTPQ